MDFFEPADIVIYIQGRGAVLKEKSLLAYDDTTKKITAYGKEAENSIENPSENIKVISPLRRGQVADYIGAVKLFRYLLGKIGEKKLFGKPAVAVSLPEGATEVEKKAAEDVLYQAGAGAVVVSEIPMEQLMEEMPKLTKNGQKFKTFISITKEEPSRYVKEQFSELFSYGRREGISSGRIIELLQEEAAGQE